MYLEVFRNQDCVADRLGCVSAHMYPRSRRSALKIVRCYMDLGKYSYPSTPYSLANAETD